ncbi:MAG: hypothetical protein ACREOQ_08915 [Gemmatimonadales bacterium]
MRSRPVVASLALGLCAWGAAGCTSKAEAPRGPRVTVRWTGADTASFSARAVAEWCAPLHLLEIRAVAGDTGVGMVLYPPDTIDAGRYPIRRPDLADTMLPPSAALALRWFSQTTVMGFQGDSGSLMLERRPDGSLGGRFNAGARPLVTGTRLHATGTFDGLRVVPAPSDCAGRPSADSANADTAQPDTGARGPVRPDRRD